MKNRRVTIKLTDIEFNTLTLKASALGLNKSQYLVNAINNKDKISNIETDNYKILGSVNKIGNNLNQIAKNLNIANKSFNLNDYDYDLLIDKLTIIEYLLNEYLNECKK
jgi:hypothetical protein